MKRFLLLAIPLLVLLSALFNLGLELAGAQPDLGPLLGGGRPGARGLAGAWVLATWLLEALALAALFLLVDGRGGAAWFNGLLAGWTAWVFRGPLLVMTVAGFAALPPAPWWRLSLRWLALYTLAGLLLGALAARPSEPAAPAAGLPPTAVP